MIVWAQEGSGGHTGNWAVRLEIDTDRVDDLSAAESRQITEIIRKHPETVLRASDGRLLGRWNGATVALPRQLTNPGVPGELTNPGTICALPEDKR